MGQSWITPRALEPARQLEREIEELIGSSRHWTSAGCQKLVLLSKKRLSQLSVDDLDRVRATVGLEVDERSRDEICERLLSVIERQTKLLEQIRETVITAQNRLQQVRVGKVCQNSRRYIDNFLDCREAGGIWLDQTKYQSAVERLKLDDRYTEYTYYFDQLDRVYTDYFAQLQRVVERLRKPQLLNSDELPLVEEHVADLLRRIRRETESIYLVVVNSLD